MASQKYANLAQSTLASSYTAGNTTITVQPGDGALFPAAGDFTVAMDDPPKFFLKCTSRAGDVLTVSATGQEGTSAVNLTAPTKVTQVITAGVLDNFRSDISGVGTYANLPASGMKAGDRYICTDGPYSFVYTGSIWQAFACGNPVTVPPSAGWSWANQGSSTVTASAGMQYFVLTAIGADGLRGYMRSATSPFTLTLGVIQQAVVGSTDPQFGWGILLTDGTKYINFHLVDFSGQGAGYRATLTKWTNTTTSSANYNVWAASANTSLNGALWGRPLWYRVVVDSSNFTWHISFDGFNWQQYDQRAKSDFLGTLTQVGVGGYTRTAANVTLISFDGVA